MIIFQITQQRAQEFRGERFGAKMPLTLLFSLVSIKGFRLSNKAHKTTSSDVQRLGGPLM